MSAAKVPAQVGRQAQPMADHITTDDIEVKK